jgi:putative ABC transport system ATP-binding protein
MKIRHFDSPVKYGATGDPIIHMSGITKIFHTAAGDATVLKGIDVEILQGQFVSVVGRSGSGKSTLVNMITGIDKPTSGSVEIGGRPILDMHESEMAVWRGRNLGIVFQFFQLLPMLTLIENVMLPMDFCNIYTPTSREKKALELLRRVGLEHFAYNLPGAIAGGQQQCAAVARALANDPPILIADEPTGNLDSKTAEQVMSIFEELAAQGKTVLIVTHDKALARRSNRRLLISDGELVNESLAAAFPDAPHRLLLDLTKKAVPLDLAPHETLTSPVGLSEQVYLVAQGELLSGAKDKKARVTKGDFLDSRSIKKQASAGKQGAHLLALPRSAVQSALAGEGHKPEATASKKPKRRTAGRAK